MSFVCPKCKTANSLWRDVEVPGWQSVDGDLKPDGGDREVEWDHAEGMGTYGCGNCNIDDLCRSDLVTLGLDGEPLPREIPGQLKLATDGSTR